MWAFGSEPKVLNDVVNGFVGSKILETKFLDLPVRDFHVFLRYQKKASEYTTSVKCVNMKHKRKWRFSGEHSESVKPPFV